VTLTIGTQLGSHEITALLGKGGMGEVYRARDLKLKREVAIKILAEEFSRDADRVNRFQREAEVLASLNHPNIAAIHDLEETGGTRYLVLELVEGETLAERIARGPVPIPECLTIAKQIAEALEAAHERNVVHRDLKPSNVKITPQGKVKVLDFGLARMLVSGDTPSDFSESPTLLSGSHTGVIMGTAPYMSPEQARGQTVDAQTDVWAFGCVLFEMLSGHPAFTGETITDVLGGIVRIDPDWTALPADTPPLLRLLLRQCLQKTRSARLHHIGDARIQMEAAGEAITPVAAAQPASSRRWPAGWIAVTAVLVLAVAGLIAGWRYYTHPPNDAAVVFTISPPEKNAIYSASVSPNGRYVAFITVSEALSHVWLRAVDSAEPRVLQGTDGVTRSVTFWSPVSRSVGFFANGKLKTIDISGGHLQNVCDAPGAVTGTWGSKGVILFGTGNNGGTLRRVAASGGTAEAATTLDKSRNEDLHVAPVFLPDGDHFLFFARTPSGEDSAVMAGSLTSKEVKIVKKVPSMAYYDAAGYIFFIRDGSMMAQGFDPKKLETKGDAFPIADGILNVPNYAAFTASGSGIVAYEKGGSGWNRNLTWFDRSGKQLGTVGPPGQYRNPELSPDGKRVAVMRLDPESQNEDI
jgi:hypothetical protein